MKYSYARQEVIRPCTVAELQIDFIKNFMAHHFEAHNTPIFAFFF